MESGILLTMIVITSAKLQTLSSIFRDAAQVFLAGLFLDPLAAGEWNVLKIALGIAVAITLWLLSLTFSH